MKLKLLALAAIASLLFAGVAVAKTNKLKGKVKGDSGSRVTLSVVTKKRREVAGKPKRTVPVKMKGLKFRKVDYSCSGGKTGQKSFKIGSAPIILVPGAGYYTDWHKTSKGVHYDGFARFNRKGTKAKGTIKFDFTDEGQECTTSSTLHWSAKRKKR